MFTMSRTFRAGCNFSKTLITSQQGYFLYNIRKFHAKNIYNARCTKNHNLNNVINFYLRRRFSHVNSICWNCKKNTNYINEMFCEHCKTLREPDKEENYFDILNLDKTYCIDLTNLSKRYKNLQKLLHPDKFTNRPSKEQELSLEWSSRVNKAYSTLNNPIQRAEYLLQNLGQTLSELSETKDTVFLMEMMERNEEIAAISTPEEALKYLKNIQQIINDHGIELGKNVEEKDLKKALKILGRMKYFCSLEQNLKNKAASLTGTLTN